MIQLFFSLFRYSSAYFGRIMIRGLAEEGIQILTDVLNSRKVYLGNIERDGEVDYIEKNFSDSEIEGKIRAQQALNFTSSVFPQDIGFKDIEDQDHSINDWDEICENIDPGSDLEDVLSFIAFSGNNVIAENSLRQFIKNSDDLDDHKNLEEDFVLIRKNLEEIRNVFIERNIKLLVHSVDNFMYVLVYSPEMVEPHKEDLSVYLTERNYPFGSLIGVINLNISMMDRKDGVIENNFRKGNVNSTYDFIKSKLLVAPSIKAVIDDVARRVTANKPVIDQIGFVMSELGDRRLPTIVDFVYLPSAILSLAKSVTDISNNMSYNEGVMAKNDFSSFLAKYVMNRAETWIDNRYDRDELLDKVNAVWEDDSMGNTVCGYMEAKNIPFTRYGVESYVSSWRSLIRAGYRHNANDVALFYQIAFHLGYENYNVKFRGDPTWIDIYSRREKARYDIGYNSGNDDPEFLEGLFKLVKSLNSADYGVEDSRNKLTDFIEGYDIGMSYNLASGKKMKNMRLEALAAAIQIAYSAVTRLPGDEEDATNQKSDRKGANIRSEVLR